MIGFGFNGDGGIEPDFSGIENNPDIQIIGVNNGKFTNLSKHGGKQPNNKPISKNSLEYHNALIQYETFKIFSEMPTVFFRQSTVMGCVFKNIKTLIFDIVGSTMSDCIFNSDCIFGVCGFTDATITHCTFENVTFKGFVLDRCKIKDCIFKNCTFLSTTEYKKLKKTAENCIFI